MDCYIYPAKLEFTGRTENFITNSFDFKQDKSSVLDSIFLQTQSRSERRVFMNFLKWDISRFSKYLSAKERIINQNLSAVILNLNFPLKKIIQKWDENQTV